MKLSKLLFSGWIIINMFFLSCATKNEEVKEIPKHIQTISTTEDLDISTGQMVYVPAYSQIHSVFTNKTDARINLAVTLSIRNTDINNPIIIKSVSYYGDDGTMLKEYVETPFQLTKMASVSFNINQTDVRGGIGANFIVEWGAKQSVTEPYIQAIMIGLHSTQGFSWRNPGYVIKEIRK